MTTREPTSTELATILCEWDQPPHSCRCAQLDASSEERCQSPIEIARTLLHMFKIVPRTDGVSEDGK